jgi:hypothetical protein
MKSAGYGPGMSERKTRITITVDPLTNAYAERLVAEGNAPSVSAAFSQALEEKAYRDLRLISQLKDIASRADHAKVARMMAHVDAQVAQLPDSHRFR